MGIKWSWSFGTEDNDDLISKHKEILQNMQFDYIYHEHTYYFTIKTLSNYAKLYNLYPNDIQRSKITHILVF
mgnify:CR=1 FL=1